MLQLNLVTSVPVLRLADLELSYSNLRAFAVVSYKCHPKKEYDWGDDFKDVDDKMRMAV